MRLSALEYVRACAPFTFCLVHSVYATRTPPHQRTIAAWPLSQLSPGVCGAQVARLVFYMAVGGGAQKSKHTLLHENS